LHLRKLTGFAATKKQGHRILVDTPLAKVILRIEDEIDSHAWYQTISKAIEQHKIWASKSNQCLNQRTFSKLQKEENTDRDKSFRQGK